MQTFLEYITTLSVERPAGTPPETAPSGYLNISPNFPKPLNVSFADLSNPKVLDDINNHLEVGLFDPLITPYVALERARKVLTPYGIVIQAVAWLNGDDGEQTFPIYQWGGLFGTKGVGTNATDTIDTNLKVNSELSVYFSWSFNDEKHGYDVYAAVVNQAELKDLLKRDFDGTPFDDQDDIEDAMNA
jgi:hypothetical protein